jgi:hypothetical protein
MKQNPTFEIGIEGFADPRGTDAYNQALRVRSLLAPESACRGSGRRARGPLSFSDAGGRGTSRPLDGGITAPIARRSETTPAPLDQGPLGPHDPELLA